MQNLNYEVVGNCRSAALISETGSIDWFCIPDFDSPSIFSRILNVEKGGEFSFEAPRYRLIDPDYTVVFRS
jgi:GH15 family glucan-1,4-alpha-glucosidase